MRVASVARWLTFALLAAAPAAGQAPDPAVGAAFRPLLADPKEPQFFAAYLWERSPRLAPRPRRGVLAVQPRPADRRPDEYRLSRRPPLHLPPRRPHDPRAAVPPELAPGRRVHGVRQRAADRSDLRSRRAAGVAAAGRVAGVWRRRVPVHALARRPEAGCAPRWRRVSPTRRPAAPRAVGDGARRGRGGREVVPGPGLHPRLERDHRAGAGRSPRPRRGRLALEPAAACLHRSRPLRRVLSRPRGVARRGSGAGAVSVLTS